MTNKVRSLHHHLLSSNHKGIRERHEMQEKIGENFYDFAGRAGSNNKSAAETPSRITAKTTLVRVWKTRNVAALGFFCSV